MLVESQPRQRAGDVLVGVQAGRSDPIGVAHGVRPVLPRVLPGQREAGRDRGHDGGQRGEDGAAVPAQQEVQQEHRRRELERDAQPQQQPARPRRATRHTLGDHQRHQHDIDLPEGEVGLDRLEVERCPGHDQRGQPPPAQPRWSGHHTGGGPDVEPGQHDHRGDQQQRQRDQRDGDAGGRHAQPGERSEEDRGQRGIGERQVQADRGVELGVVAVQRMAVQPGLAAHAVDVDVDPVRRGPDQPPPGVAQRRQCRQLKQQPAGVSPAARLRCGHLPARTARVGRAPSSHVGEQPIGASAPVGVVDGHRRQVRVAFLTCCTGSNTTSSVAADYRCCAV